MGGFLGNIGEDTDESDVFEVQMAMGQTATLLIADPDTNDFDLVLYNKDGQERPSLMIEAIPVETNSSDRG